MVVGLGLTIAVVPARYGSRRVPKKNLRSFLGRPLLEWTIVAAIESGCFDRVCLSTDSEELAQIGEECGADIPFLRENFADDEAPVARATVEMATKVFAESGEISGTVAQLLPVCPLRMSSHVITVMDFFAAMKSGNSVVSASKFLFQPPWWAAVCDQELTPSYLHSELLKSRSQDLPPALSPNGAIWVSDFASLVEHNTFYSPDHKLFEIPWVAGLDIDTEDDFRLAEIIGINRGYLENI